MKIIRTISCVLAAALGLSVAAAPQRSVSGVTVTSSIDSTVVTMGSTTHVRVTVQMPESAAAAVNLDGMPELAAGEEYLPWNGVDIVAVDSASTIADGMRTIGYDYTVQAFDPGTLTLPPFTVVTGAADTAFSNVLTLKVLPVEVDSTMTLNPMAGVAAPATKWYDYIPTWVFWVFLALVVVALCVVAFIAMRKHKEEIEERRTPPVPPYELAISRLNDLRTSNLASSGQEMAYYTELVDILRQYLHGRFGINAMEMTSTQIVKALRANPATKMSADQMRSVLSMADFVKFAKVRPMPGDNTRAMTRALDFVEETKPVPEPEPGTGDAPGNANTGATPQRPNDSTTSRPR